MAAKKFIRNVLGTLTEVLGVQVSAGVANAGDIPSLDDNGRLHTSMMPVGIGADTKILAASEALAAGDYVNVWNDTGVAKARKADATTAGKRAHGFVLEAVASGANATVYFEGTNNQITGMVPGEVYLGTTAGAGQGAAPTVAGNIVQKVGVAVSATEVNFEPSQPITLA